MAIQDSRCTSSRCWSHPGPKGHVLVPGTGAWPRRTASAGAPEPSGCQLPGLLADQRHFAAAGDHRVHPELRPADHEVDVDVADVRALVELAVERIRKTHPVGDVTGRVLVEERVEEERPGLADPRLVRDERKLPEAIGVLDGVDLAPDEICPLLRVDGDDPSVLERELEAPDDLSVEDERQ